MTLEQQHKLHYEDREVEGSAQKAHTCVRGSRTCCGCVLTTASMARCTTAHSDTREGAFKEEYGDHLAACAGTPLSVVEANAHLVARFAIPPSVTVSGYALSKLRSCFA